MRFVPHLLAGIAAAAAMVGANAATTNFSGTLATTDGLFNRPFDTTSLSGVGTAVRFDSFPFFVNSAATFTLQTLSANLAPSTFGPDDTFLALYSPSFLSGSPLTGLLALNDDGPGIGGLSLFSQSLVPGVQYVMVVTSYSNGALGPYTGSISAPGAATAIFGVVPEPSTTLLMLAGLGMAGLTVARRKQS